ncbi:nucleoside diphosphate kinase, mitochondrial isoform X3 [Micropterus salmoides]|uniref:nucleoside diphosphate kinase, mitochondrial isoform X3 n=1 Tax=Micropterus salmoides TaxID=27706 RepID=UPI0018ECCF5D|nr:nucleoside diphosphate kinase, mitochondrial isoform X3 [Micropterus salmoides]
MTSLPEGWQNTRQNMIMLQHCILKRVLQQFYSGNQETTKSLLSGFPAALQHGHRAAGHRSKSTVSVLKVSEDLLSQHYCELRTKPFYPSLLHYMTSGPVVVMVWEGHKVVQTSRKMVGHTNPAEAQAGTVRGDFSIHVSRNVVHASDSLEGAQREIQLWFQGKELLNWDCCDQTSTCEV